MGTSIVDFSVKGFASPASLRASAIKHNIGFVWSDIDPQGSFRRYSKWAFKYAGQSFESAICFEDDNYLISGIMILQKNQKTVSRIQVASIRFSKADEKIEIAMPAKTRDTNPVVVGASDKLLKRIMDYQAGYDHYSVRSKIVQKLESTGVVRLVPQRSSCWIVPNDYMPEVKEALSFLTETLPDSRVFEIEINSNETTKNNIKESVKDSISLSLGKIKEELEAWQSGEKQLRPSVIAKRIDTLRTMSSQVETYEKALEFKMDSLKNMIQDAVEQVNNQIQVATKAA